MHDFGSKDRCILKVFGSLEFIGDFRIASDADTDDDGEVFYPIDEINEWDYPVDQRSLPSKYTEQLSRSPSIEISESDYWELIGIQNFTQNVKLNYKNRLTLNISEHEVESLIDSKDALSELGLSILERHRSQLPAPFLSGANR